MSDEAKNWVLRTRAGYYAKKRKPGNLYSNPVWYWTADLKKARRVTRQQALNIRTTLFIENTELFHTSVVEEAV